jgi:hypothetical protein
MLRVSKYNRTCGSLWYLTRMHELTLWLLYGWGGSEYTAMPLIKALATENRAARSGDM